MRADISAVDVREVTPEDGPALVDSAEAISSETEFLVEPGALLPLKGVASELLLDLRKSGNGTYYLAVCDGSIVGYLAAFRGSMQRASAVITVVAVGLRRSYRGKGVGVRLLKAAREWACQKGARRLELIVEEANRGAISLYQKAGFRIEGRIADATFRDGSWHADLWMGLALEREEELPHWDMLELRPPKLRVDISQVTFGAPCAEHAQQLHEWERALLAGSSIHLKLPGEVPFRQQIVSHLSSSRANGTHAAMSAFAYRRGEKRIVGHVSGQVGSAPRDRNLIFRLNVLPQYTGAGIGRRLADEIEAWARQNGMRRLSTWLQGHNARGLSFAEQRGFQREIISREYAIIDGRLCDRVALGKVLT